MTSLDKLFGQTGDGVAIIDKDLRIIHWNQAAAELFGYSSEEALGKTCHEVIQGLDERSGLLCGPECSLIQCARQGERLHNFNMLARKKDGRPLWLDVSTIYVPELEEERDVVVHLFRSIDNVKRAQLMIDEIISLAVKEGPTPESPLASRESPPDLTPRELDTLKLLARGLAAKAIARELTITENTARNHIQSILNKLGAHSQLEAVLVAQRHRLI